MKVKDITPLRVAQWLSAKGDDDVVGYTCQDGRCPLALCLSEMNGHKRAIVGSRRRFVEVGYGQYHQRENAGWMRTFVRLVDLSHGGVVAMPVTAREAKDILLSANAPTRRAYHQIVNLLVRR